VQLIGTLGVSCPSAIVGRHIGRVNHYNSKAMMALGATLCTRSKPFPVWLCPLQGMLCGTRMLGPAHTYRTPERASRYAVRQCLIAIAEINPEGEILAAAAARTLGCGVGLMVVRRNWDDLGRNYSILLLPQGWQAEEAGSCWSPCGYLSATFIWISSRWWSGSCGQWRGEAGQVW